MDWRQARRESSQDQLGNHCDHMSEIAKLGRERVCGISNSKTWKRVGMWDPLVCHSGLSSRKNLILSFKFANPLQLESSRSTAGFQLRSYSSRGTPAQLQHWDQGIFAQHGTFVMVSPTTRFLIGLTQIQKNLPYCLKPPTLSGLPPNPMAIIIQFRFFPSVCFAGETLE